MLLSLTAFCLPLTLEHAPNQLTANGYYLNSLIDESASPVMSAEMIEQYFKQNLTQDIKGAPVNITLKNFTLTETSLAGGLVHVQIKLALSFGLQKDYGTEQLVGYSGGRGYTRSATDQKVNETQLRNVLTNSIIWFNNWMAANLPVNRKLATSIHIDFSDYSEPIEGDTIYYRPERPLAWADFKSKMSTNSIYAAKVIPGFGYEEKDTVVNGVIRIDIALKTFLPKSACWANPWAKSDYALEHEQKHFDIARMIAGRFQQKILDQKLSPDTYQAFISMQYIDSYRDLDTMQTVYDKETRHGQDTDVQKQWNQHIAKQLKIENSTF